MILPDTLLSHEIMPAVPLIEALIKSSVLFSITITLIPLKQYLVKNTQNPLIHENILFLIIKLQFVPSREVSTIRTRCTTLRPVTPTIPVIPVTPIKPLLLF